MVREYNTRHAETTHTSVGNSTMSDFDPENEALVSTRQLDNSDKLPELQDSARKNRTSPRQEPDYDINTSAIERAFPEFSDVDSSPEEEEEDNDDDISIEVGRGSKKPQHRLDDSRNSMISFENSVRSSSPAIKLDYPPPSHTPPKSALRSSSKRTGSGENLRKDAQIRRASQTQKENVDPQPNKSKNQTTFGTRSTEQRRTLAEMHAKVRETYEGSYISDERPQNIAVNARTTRFGHARDVSVQVAAAVEQASREALLKESRRGKLATNSRNVPANATYTTNTFPDTGTYQSFLLPDLPNLSELVSGVYEDGTPVFPRQSKSRATRFVSPPGQDLTHTQDHLPVDAVPIPEDEKALFVSLKLLQDKVAELEFAKSEAERKLDDVRQENMLLKADKSRRQKEQHDRLKMLEEDQGRSSGRLLQEKNRLETANLALQNRLDIAERKIQVHETALKNLTRERDSAVSQLGVAYLNTQEIKRENESLRREIAELRAQLAKLTSLSQKLAGHEGDTRHSTSQKHWEADAVTVDSNGDDSQVYTQRSVEGTRRGHEQSRNQDRGSKTAPQEDTRARISNQIDKEIHKIEKERQDEELFSLNLSQPTRTSTHHKPSQSVGHSKAESAEGKKQPNTSKQRVKRVIVEDANTSEPLEVNVDNLTEDARNQTSTDQDLTFLSYIDSREIAQLRKTLEEERAARKQRQAAANASAASKRQSGQASDLSRKSSLKETKETKESIPQPSSATGEPTVTGKIGLVGHDDQAQSEPRRRHSDNSIPSRSRRRRPTAEMTSAFILPDITLRYADSEVHPPAKLSESAQKVLNSVARHDGKNCTVCKRLLPNGVPHDHEHGDSRETITIPKPVPVSQRMPEPSVYNEEPTMRPSQPPALALATVLKGLEDELAHLKMQLATCQSAYTKHDASLSKRQRKSLSQRIEKLLKEVDTKADQIYALYDVLEGQKQDGHEMTEHEVEVTLQSIGIDINEGRPIDVTGATDDSSRKKAEAHDDTEDDDDELPWEGIESTAEVTGRSVGSRR
ncbi:hypothetical protein VTN77DRAFT_6772 [Rasamsonia byssochlamydoides]|uniref:uncharacterized protein n=1 Tax=Rasamsonia byssochlamydoides TaxID=89139 RepID=UPI0037435D33